MSASFLYFTVRRDFKKLNMIIRLISLEKKPLIWKRLVASLIDYILVTAMTMIISMLSPMPIQDAAATWIWLGVFMIYSIFFDYYQYGTPGKHIMKIKLLYSQDNRSYLLTIFYRNFLKVIFFSWFSWMLFAPDKQGVHNKVARCSIVET